MHLPPRARPRAPKCAREAGFSVFEAVFLVAIVGSVIAAVLGVCVAGSHAQGGAHARQELTRAAADRLAGTVPASAGGAIAPTSSVTGWTDVVYPLDGAYVVLDSGTPPAGAMAIRRQWRVRSDADGFRVFDVSAQTADPSTLNAVSGNAGDTVVVSRTVR